MKSFSDKIFTFTSYDFDKKSGKLDLNYTLDEVSFTETLTFPIEGVDWNKVDEAALNRAFFALHLIGGTGYWKTYCPKNIVIESGELTRPQAHFWNEIYKKGLGQFYYENEVDFRDQIHFPYNKELEEPEIHGSDTRDEAFLVAIGGGKDSIVTAELLKDLNLPVTMFSVQDSDPIRRTADMIGGERLIVKRKLAESIFELNKRDDVFNGHVPISAIWSMMAIVTAIIHNQTDVVFSWEKSASSGNLEYLGLEVNHQYSKSIEYERALQQYLSSYVSKDVRIYSILRPLTELNIVKLFSQMPDFHSIFTSCNRNFTQKAIAEGQQTFWCSECPKCAFIFVLLDAWLPHERTVEIFGADMLASEAMLDEYRRLLGIFETKPFECVGEPDEVAAAFELIHKRGDAEETAAMQMYLNEARDTARDVDALIAKELEIDRDNAIPKDIRDRIDYAF